MLAVGLTPERAGELVGDDPRVDIAAINSGDSLTLSVDIDRLDEIAEKLTGDTAFARRLRVEVPYHSRLMDPILAEPGSELADLSPRPPRVPLYSTVTGDLVTDADWDVVRARLSPSGQVRRMIARRDGAGDGTHRLIEPRSHHARGSRPPMPSCR